MNPCLIVSCPTGYDEERKYILKVLLEDFLGFSFIVHVGTQKEYQISIQGDLRDKTLILADVLFQTPLKEWLTHSSLQPHPLPVWDVSTDLPEQKPITSSIPIIYGEPFGGMWLAQKEHTLRLGLDIFGSAFFMLTRYEELVKTERDEHDRFPAAASLAFQEGFLERPIVEEYVEILLSCLQRLWPGINRKRDSFNIFLSHDVDHPFMICEDRWPTVFKNMAGDVLRRKKPGLAIRRFSCRWSKNILSDPTNSFDFILEQSEHFGLNSEFYFIADHTAKFDGTYAINNPEIKVLMRRIHERGHKLGLHSSYNSYRNSFQLCHEYKRLLQVASELGIKQDAWGGRQHFLRWENPTTWQTWEDASLDYDTTLSYADHIGFRCGTSKGYPVFNLRTREPLELRELPLLVMDRTLFDQKYMGLTPEQALEKIAQLSNMCRRFSGTFSMLWHNTSLAWDEEKQLFREIMKTIVL